MDFKSIIQSTDRYNFHSHTEYCDGHSPMAVMAEAAVRSGMLHYGFSPHSPISIPSPCNMKQSDTEAYLEQVRLLQSLPELSSCHFYAGMEVDYLGDEWGPANDYFKSLPLDYTIGSVHFIPSQSGDYVDIDGKYEQFKRRMSENFRDDIEYVVDTFYNQTLDMIDRGGFDILGHFDKIAHNASIHAPGIEDSSFYRPYIARMIDAISRHDLIIELNTKARLEHGRFFPSERHLAELVKRGITIMVNSDAHRPDRIDACRSEAFKLLKEKGYVPSRS